MDKPKDQDENGIFQQEEWKTLPPTATVLAVGKSVTFCKAGDKVFYERYSALDFPEGDDQQICHEKHILATL